MAVGLFVFLLFLHFGLGVIGGFYKKATGFGAFVHFCGGLFLASVLPFICALLAAILWEIFEYLFDRYVPQYSGIVCWYSRSWDAAVHDVCWTWVGITVLFALAV